MHGLGTVVRRLHESPTVRHRGEASVRHSLPCLSVPTAFPQRSSQYIPPVRTYFPTLSQLPHRHRSLLPQPPPPPPPPHARSHPLEVQASCSYYTWCRSCPLSRYLISICLWRPLAPTQFSHNQSGHTPGLERSSFLVGPPHHLCCQEIRKALEPTATTATTGDLRSPRPRPWPKLAYYRCLPAPAPAPRLFYLRRPPSRR